MIRSMTGIATGRGAAEGHGWSWELRAVNARGLDLRMRLPEGVPGLEAALRARLGAALARGSVTLSLRLAPDGAAAGPAIDATRLDAALGAVAEVEARAAAAGVALAPVRATDLLSMGGVLSDAAPEAAPEALRAALLADFEPVLAAFLESREAEGRALAPALRREIDTIERLTDAAAAAAGDREAAAAEALRAALDRVRAAVEVDEDRLAQELALIAVKADVAEELDRLAAHVAQARALLDEGGAVGRRLDFLTQEFNREANTLCSKSGDTALTRIGLEMKAAVDRMREQVQNVE
ncbi:YicC/YloC family endoribonuclease [Rhodosalinus sediminis]|uniref:YicC/YloC family endoribonuclease n=1 Tax=Rhodosalinus sediminis TaxID=1940533 RepID=UPI002356E0C7|nr:YicC/YloC family endoribonuclease [Rhodosalinus sediminis]